MQTYISVSIEPENSEFYLALSVGHRDAFTGLKEVDITRYGPVKRVETAIEIQREVIKKVRAQLESMDCSKDNKSRFSEFAPIANQEQVNWQSISLEDVPENNRPAPCKSLESGDYLLEQVFQNELGQIVAFYKPIDGRVVFLGIKQEGE
jgi:hypothetical protein